MARWTRTISIGKYEKQYMDNEISLQEMARKIHNYLTSLPIYGYGDGKDDDFTEIVDGELHTIAYQDEIFEDDEDRPTVNDYDGWKEDLYDWADSVDEAERDRLEALNVRIGFANTPKNAWIEPAPMM